MWTLNVLTILFALSFLMFMAYRGFSVILFAPLAAGVAILLTSPHSLLPLLSGVFMERMAVFLKLYFPIFMLGAIFGKMAEISGFARSIISAVVTRIGADRAILAVVLVCAILTYGGVSLFVVAFAVYPFGAELFRLAAVPKKLLPATIALGAFTFTMDALPGSPQIQNIIPTIFFQTNTWAAPRLGLAGSVFMFLSGIGYLEWQHIKARKKGEGYGGWDLIKPTATSGADLPSPWLALVPLVLVGSLNRVFTAMIPRLYGKSFDFKSLDVSGPGSLDIEKLSGIWAVEGALVAGILFILATSFLRMHTSLNTSLHTAIGGAMLAALNTGSEFGFGAVIAVLPGFHLLSDFLSRTVQDPLTSVALTTNALAGITGSASGGLSIALTTMGQTYMQHARAAGISFEVLHRIAAMSSGGMDTLPHNGAVITLLAITGLTHRDAYRGIFAMTIIKTLAVVFVIAFYYVFKIY